MSGIITEAHRNWMLKLLVEKLEREQADIHACAVEHAAASGFIPKNAYDIRRDAFRTCLSCGSRVQPCCGH